MSVKTLAVVTSTRADYGLLRPVLQKLFKQDNIKTNLLVTGTHVEPSFGNTVKEIEADGLPIQEKIQILKETTSDTLQNTLIKFSKYFQKNKTDAVLVLGDRFEIFAVASAAAVNKVPIIHISGGDVTMGADDDFYRHCISKMSALHFPSCEDSKARLLRLGEQPSTVHNVGGLGDENIRNLVLPNKQKLEESIKFDLSGKYALVTFHPETATNQSPLHQCNALLKALEKIELKYIFTKANADEGGVLINEAIDNYVATHENCIAFTSMGVLRYLAAMRDASAVIGNSSSGVVETPTFKVPTLNIGQRQAGRIVCDNVLCCDCTQEDIEKSINIILTDDFKQKANNAKSPYHGDNTSSDMVKIIAEFLYSDKLNLPKVFYDGKA